jgi:hypothetical protein
MSERKPSMKFTKPFRGVPNGEFYPVAYAPGDECPAELLEAAQIMGAVEAEKPKAKAK